MLGGTYDDWKATEPDAHIEYVSCFTCGGPSLEFYCRTCTQQALEDDAELARRQMKRLGHEPDPADDAPNSDGRRR